MYLRNLYYNINSPIAYTSEINLWKQIKADCKQIEINRNKLKNWLGEQYTYTLHKSCNKPRAYRKVMGKNIDDQWQADLVEMREFSKSNDGYNYILTVIDCFSKFGWVEPLKTKTGLETANAFSKIFESGRMPRKIHFDEGKEFYNKNVKDLLEKRNIDYFSTFSDKKASIVERWNRTLKSRTWKYFTEHETRQWIDVIQAIVNGYNNTYHTTIKMTPSRKLVTRKTRKLFGGIFMALI